MTIVPIMEKAHDQTTLANAVKNISGRTTFETKVHEVDIDH